MTVTIYSAEESSGDLFMVAGWVGLDRAGFRELVLDRLSTNGIPEPDWNIQELDLCEWVEDTFAEWFSPHRPITPEALATWKNARFTTLYWTYPGVWSETQVTSMPPALAAEFWSGEGVELDDPKHPTWHDRMADLADNR